ncbi:MAG: DsbA family protein [Alphaproteobacteria bacterium]
MDRFFLWAATAVVALVLAAPAQTQQSRPAVETEILESVDPAQRRVTEAIVRDYILRNPEIVLEAIRILQSREQAAAGERALHALAANRDALRYDPMTPVGGNPDGDVTIVEFFDYACPYCRNAHPVLAQLTKDDPNLRIVYKEYPVLGEASVAAARVGIAVHLLAPDSYAAYHAAMLQARGRLSADLALQTAVEAGVDRLRLQETVESEAVATLLGNNIRLAQAIGVEGTPGFVIGDTVVPGLIQMDQFKQLIGTARERCTTC